MPWPVLMGALSALAPATTSVKPATSAGRGCSLGDVTWVLRSSTDVAAASDGWLVAGSFLLLSPSVQSSASFHVINKLGSVIYLTNKTLIRSLAGFFFI